MWVDRWIDGCLDRWMDDGWRDGCFEVVDSTCFVLLLNARM